LEQGGRQKDTCLSLYKSRLLCIEQNTGVLHGFGKTNYLLFVCVFLVGCASPTVVQESQLGDDELSCSQLVDATEEAKDFERAARGERKATGTNVAAAVFFWPGLIVTYANSEDAISAATERQRNLKKLYDKKGCSGSAASSAGGGTLTSQLKELRELRQQELITEEEYSFARKKLLGN
tara:strand:- start:6963 stop:7499 length:537 start_codon:yes stop_codon:yes gene_type:complete